MPMITSGTTNLNAGVAIKKDTPITPIIPPGIKAHQFFGFIT
jgi:hypothetical protein